VLILWLPFTRSLFHFSAVSAGGIALILAAAALSLLWLELLKLFHRRL